MRLSCIGQCLVALGKRTTNVSHTSMFTDTDIKKRTMYVSNRTMYVSTSTIYQSIMQISRVTSCPAQAPLPNLYPKPKPKC